MYKGPAAAAELASALRQRLGQTEAVEVGVCPPFVSLPAAKAALEGSPIRLGAQDLYWKAEGAYTGEVSPAMLVELGCQYVIVGHSERRGRFGVPEPELLGDLGRIFAENDATVNRKAVAALEVGLRPIICVGENLQERREGKTDAVVEGQVRAALQSIHTRQAPNLVLAYEPVWAIGTGEVCEAEEANRVCGLIRRWAAEALGGPVGEALRIQYGGSVKPDNAEELMAQPEIDGALVGGASLVAESFETIVRLTERAKT